MKAQLLVRTLLVPGEKVECLDLRPAVCNMSNDKHNKGICKRHSYSPINGIRLKTLIRGKYLEDRPDYWFGFLAVAPAL